MEKKASSIPAAAPEMVRLFFRKPRLAIKNGTPNATRIPKLYLVALHYDCTYNLLIILVGVISLKAPMMK